MANERLQLLKLMNTTEQTEEWVKVAGFPDYEVSSLGGIRPVVARFKKNKNGLVQYMHGNYATIGLRCRETGLHKTLTVHRLVATAFVPNPEKMPCVNHKDGNKLNNIRENLEWVTYKQNTAHAIDKGLFKNKGEDQWRHVLKAEQVIEVVGLGRSGISPTLLGRKYNVARTTICDILAGRNWSSVTGIKQQTAAA